MANLSNINNKLVVTTDGAALINQGTTDYGTAKLQVSGNGSSPTITWRNDSGRKTGYLYSDSAGIAIYSTALDKAGIYMADDVQIDFRVNGSVPKMIIDSDGDVGIGTITPATKLDVYQGDIRRSGIVSGGYIEMGSLPGYSANAYQCLTSGASLHFANNGKYCAYLEGANTAFGILNSSEALQVKLNSSGDSYFTGGNVGIGTTTPGYKLEVNGNMRSSTVTVYDGMGGSETGIGASGAGGNLRLYAGGTNRVTVATSAVTLGVYAQDTIGSNYIQFYNSAGTAQGYMGFGASNSNDMIISQESANVNIRFLNGGLERMRIDNNGSIGMGANSTSYRLRVKTDTTVTNGIYLSAGTGNSNHSLYVEDRDGTAEYFAVRGDGQIRLHASRVGDTLFGCTALPSASVFGSAFKSDSKSRYTLMQSCNDTGLSDLQEFFNPNGAVGKIQTSGSATIFNTASDYRLKEDLQDFAGLDIISKIPVYDFKWKIDGKRSYGVMAHELQEILPDAAAGKKDAINEDGSINPQGVDYSKIVPLLVKSIQELKADNDSLKARIETLEDK